MPAATRVISRVVTLALGLSATACGPVNPMEPLLPGPGFTAGAGSGAPSPSCAAVAIAGTAATAPLTALPGSGPIGQLFNTGVTRPVLSAETPPPPISGGTLLATHDGTLLVASDPDRDLVYFVDAASHSLLHIQRLHAGDEPGRLVEDAAGRIHVALRGGHAIASMTRDALSAITRREVCDLPRSLAYDAARDRLHVACAEGKLVSLASAPGGPVTRVIDVGRDARDVIARGDQLFVTHFRSAEMSTFDAEGVFVQSHAPATFSQPEIGVDPASASGKCGVARKMLVDNTPTIAWRIIDVPGKGIAMLHQRARVGEVQVTQGGYAAVGCGPGIVKSSISFGLETDSNASADMQQLVLAVDMAVDSAGMLLAVVAPGNWGTLAQVQVFPLSAPGASNQPTPSPNACLSGDRVIPEPPGQATAVAFVTPDVIAIQQREPATITFIDVKTGTNLANLDLQQPSRFDTGHAVFHMRAGAGVACASCHAEAGDDGHVWTFHGIGARRTQQLRGGILGTEPFHWNGDMKDFPTLVREVFVGRMAGFTPQPDQTDALAQWIDKQPELKARPEDMRAVERGKALFEAPELKCASCHSGERLTNNQSADVGTGAELQVPALRGLSFRTPLMHDGCAASLADRFGSCGGGDRHGYTSQLSKSQLDDLVAYLATL